jgi:radical SAM superfamily enzyme YgiQ (UPF0313 family)/cyclophilin family peptidyl-prolyl cis-trans isomerase
MMGAMKVLIVNPSRFYSGNWGRGELSHLFVLYSYLRQHCPGVEVDILDLERDLGTPEDALSVQSFLRNARAALHASDFDIVGISCWTSLHYLSSIAIAGLCKELSPECKVVVGGYHPSSLPQDFNYRGTPFDYIVTGEGEAAFARIVTGKVIKEKPPQLVAGTPVDTKEQELRWEEYKYYRSADKVQLWLTRGCPFSCGFCLDRNTKWRGYSPEKAVAEVRRVSQLLPSVRKISIMDPIFGLNKEWRRAFLDGIRAADLPVRYWAETRGDLLEEEDIARLGALDFQMDIGLDSVSPRMIDIMMKARHADRYLQSFLETSRLMDKHKVTHLIYGIFNYPGETPATLNEALSFWLGYYKDRPGAHGLFVSQPFAFFPGCEVFTNFHEYSRQYGARVHCPEWWKVARPSHSKMAAQVIPSRELAEEKGIFRYKEIQKEINMLATKVVDRRVRDRFRDDNSAGGVSSTGDQRLKVSDASYCQEISGGRKTLFQLEREEIRECSAEETGWLDSLLAGRTPRDLRARVAPAAEARLDKFLRLLLEHQFVQVDAETINELDQPALPVRAVIETSLGAMEFQLLAGEAPATVAHFARLAREASYDRLALGSACRGAFVETAFSASGARITPERTARLHQRGTLSMNPASSGALTICRSAWPDFDGLRTVFGVLTRGEDVLDQLVSNDLITSVRALAEALPADASERASVLPLRDG